MAGLNNRQETDSKEQHDIDKLIAEENDPKVRLHLMVMNSMNRNLIANTEATNAVAGMVSSVDKDLKAHLENFDKHTADEAARVKAHDELLSNGRFGWKIASGIIAIVQVLGLVIWDSVSSDIKSIHTAIHNSEQVDASLDKRITVLERTAK
jgi:hypothetical protein